MLHKYSSVGKIAFTLQNVMNSKCVQHDSIVKKTCIYIDLECKV